MLYRGFKEACPNGFVTAEKFDEILNYFFPYGETRQYATFVFNTFDEDGNGEISFEEFASALSILSRGSSEEKLNWVFQLYDRSGKGYVNRDDMVLIMTAIYGLMGAACCPPVTEKYIVERADDAFKKLDRDQDGMISKNDFLTACHEDKVIMSSLELFKTAYTKAEMMGICGLEDAADTTATTAAEQRQIFFQENLIKLSLPSDSPRGSPAKKKLLAGLATDTRESCV